MLDEYDRRELPNLEKAKTLLEKQLALLEAVSETEQSAGGPEKIDLLAKEIGGLKFVEKHPGDTIKAIPSIFGLLGEMEAAILRLRQVMDSTERKDAHHAVRSAKDYFFVNDKGQDPDRILRME
jgi:hypothetical protein